MSEIIQRRTLVTAHSGPDGTPDNSLENIEYVLGMKADAMELDVRKDPQGELVLSHDEVTEKDAALTLERAFQVISQHPTMKINCDLKEGNLEREVYELGRAFQLQDRLIYSGAADPENCRKLPISLYLNLEYFLDSTTSLATQIRTLETATRQEVREFLESCLAKLPLLKARSLNMHHSVFDKAFAPNEDAMAYAFSLWTVDDANTIKRYLDRGVQAITTRKLRCALDLEDSMKMH